MLKKVNNCNNTVITNYCYGWSSFSLISLSIVVNVERHEFECVGTHYSHIYGLNKHYLKKNKYDEKNFST